MNDLFSPTQSEEYSLSTNKIADIDFEYYNLEPKEYFVNPDCVGEIKKTYFQSSEINS